MVKRPPSIVVLIVVVSIFLSALVWVFFIAQIRHEREDSLQSQARHNANLTLIFAEQAIGTVQDVDGLLLDMRRVYRDKGRALRFEEVPTPSSLAKAIVYRGIIDEDGKVAVGPPPPESSNVTDRKYFKAQKSSHTDDLVIGTAVVGRTTGRPTVHISRRITTPGGEFGGVVVVGLDPRIFTELYQKVEMGGSGHVTFVGFDGLTRARRLGSVASFGDDSSRGSNFQKIVAEREQTPSGSMFAKSAVDGVERVFSFKVIPSLSMVVIVGTASEEALAAAAGRAQRYIAIACSATVLFAMLATVLMVAFIRQHKHTRQIKSLNVGLEQRIEARTADLKEANQRLEAFSYSVSHDLRGPLTTIDGFSGLLQRRKSLQADDPSLALVERIRGGVGQMTLLVDGLLSLATISRGNITREPVSLTIMARSLLKQYAQADAQRAVEVVIQDKLVVQADSRLMNSVLANLIGNAWKFTANTPSPRIEIGSLTDADGKVTFFVRDNGAGFDMASAGKLFQVFERLHSASQFEGTGIGLATVKQIIEMHCGEVWADGTPGAGATFYFTMGGEVPFPSTR
jgi:signal transduction histidine kinase